MDKSMNAPGYSGDCSPPKKKRSLNRDDTMLIRFYMNLRKDSTAQTNCVVKKNKTLCNANLPLLKSSEFQNRLVGARINGLGGTAFVNPFQLPCHFIQQDSEVEWEESNKKIYVSSQPPRDTDMKCKPFLFFISNSKADRKQKTCITNVKFAEVQHWNYICVVAYPGETFRQALKCDGRFKNEIVDRFKLNQKVEGTASGSGPRIDLGQKVQYFKKVVLQVKVSPPARRKGASVQNQNDHPLKSGSDNASTSNASTEQVSETAGKKSKYPHEKLAKTLWEENALYVYTKNVDDLTAEELHAEREACIRARAWSTLVRPQDRREEKYEKGILRVAKIEFANQHVVARPVFFSREMCKLYGAVGILTCGSVTGTCFLIGDDIVATSYHVVGDIKKARVESVPGDHTTVSVCFDYEVPDQVNSRSLRPTYELMPLDYEENVMSEQLDYAFLYLIEDKVERIALGENVTCATPERGIVSIVGHPFGNYKVEEMCPILPLDDNRRSLQFRRRLEEQAENEQDRMVLHMYRTNSFMTYDVGSMCQGSSGAPVFNMRCQIVALHTLGFSLDGNSSVEVGVTFQAIVADLKQNGYSEFVRDNFKNCEVQDME